MAAPSPHEILGVEADATRADIRRAFRRRAREIHPDMNPDDPGASHRFAELTRAYEQLSAEPVRRWQMVVAAHPGPRGPDRDAQIAVALVQTLRDVRIPLRPAVMAKCPDCTGHGGLPEAEPRACAACKGSGALAAGRGDQVCAHCAGRGEVAEPPCGACAGTGCRPGASSITVRVPAGVRDGHILRLRGAGDAGALCGPSGDLLVRVSVEGSPDIHREGDDALVEAEVPVTIAMTGGRIELPHGLGAAEIPAGTHHGDRVATTGAGFPGSDGAVGALIVLCRLQVPRARTHRAIELLRELQEELDRPLPGR